MYIRVTWAPFESGEFWSSVKLDCFAFRFSVARSARKRIYREKSAQYLTWRFRHHGETSGGDAGCYVIKDCVITATTSSGDWHVWACSILGEEPVLTQTQAPPPKMSVTDTGSSPKSLFFYYIWIVLTYVFVAMTQTSQNFVKIIILYIILFTSFNLTSLFI